MNDTPLCGFGNVILSESFSAMISILLPPATKTIEAGGGGAVVVVVVVVVISGLT